MEERGMPKCHGMQRKGVWGGNDVIEKERMKKNETE